MIGKGSCLWDKEMVEEARGWQETEEDAKGYGVSLSAARACTTKLTEMRRKRGHPEKKLATGALINKTY